MKKFELGKVYQQMNADGSVRAEFTPQFIGKDKAFGLWQTATNDYPSSEWAVDHVYLEAIDSHRPQYREKPPEPQSLELFVNIYKGKDGKIFHGGSVHSSEENANKIATSYYNSAKRKHVGIARITFTEPTE